MGSGTGFLNISGSKPQDFSCIVTCPYNSYTTQVSVYYNMSVVLYLKSMLILWHAPHTAVNTNIDATILQSTSNRLRERERGRERERQSSKEKLIFMQHLSQLLPPSATTYIIVLLCSCDQDS